MDIKKREIITIKNIRQCGVYAIINLQSNKIYIGSSNDIYNRKLAHMRDLKKQKHDNKHLQNAFNKYGIQSFVWVLIELVDDYQEVLKREQYWMDYYNACNQEFGYNMCPVAGNVLGKKLSEEAKQKISIAHKGKKKSKEHIAKIVQNHSKPIIQCSITGKFIKEWESALFASKELNITQVPISNCCLHKIRYYNDCLWFFKTEYYSEKFDVKKYIPKHAKPIMQYDLNNNYICRYNGFREIKQFFKNKDIKINTTHILECCKGLVKTSYGYIWKYENELQQEAV